MPFPLSDQESVWAGDLEGVWRTGQEHPRPRKVGVRALTLDKPNIYGDQREACMARGLEGLRVSYATLGCQARKCIIRSHELELQGSNKLILSWLLACKSKSQHPCSVPSIQKSHSPCWVSVSTAMASVPRVQNWHLWPKGTECRSF